MLSHFPNEDKSEIELFLRNDPQNNFFPSSANSIAIDPAFLKPSGSIDIQSQSDGLRITIRNPELNLWIKTKAQLKLQDADANSVAVSLAASEIWIDENAANQVG